MLGRAILRTQTHRLIYWKYRNHLKDDTKQEYRISHVLNLFVSTSTWFEIYVYKTFCNIKWINLYYKCIGAHNKIFHWKSPWKSHASPCYTIFLKCWGKISDCSNKFGKNCETLSVWKKFWFSKLSITSQDYLVLYISARSISAIYACVICQLHIFSTVKYDRDKIFT